MGKKFGAHRIASLTCLILFVFAAGNVSAAAQNRRSVHGGARARGTAAVEYAAITDSTVEGAGQGSRGVATVCYFNANGCREERVAGSDARDAFAKAVAKLGAQGWSLVGQGVLFSVPDKTALYFARPRR
jgi:hypothetical protein